MSEPLVTQREDASAIDASEAMLDKAEKDFLAATLTAKAGSKLKITIPPNFQSKLEKLMKVGQEYAMEKERLRKALGLDVLFPPEQVLKRKLRRRKAIRNKRRHK